jgi:hypothetical protein
MHRGTKRMLRLEKCASPGGGDRVNLSPSPRLRIPKKGKVEVAKNGSLGSPKNVGKKVSWEKGWREEWERFCEEWG